MKSSARRKPPWVAMTPCIYPTGRQMVRAEVNLKTRPPSRCLPSQASFLFLPFGRLHDGKVLGWTHNEPKAFQ